MSLFTRAGPLPERLALTFAVAVVLGEGRVGTPLVPDTHLPGQVAVAPFVEPPPARIVPATAAAEAIAPPPHLLATHVLRPPPEATVHRRGFPTSSSFTPTQSLVRCAAAGPLSAARRRRRTHLARLLRCRAQRRGIYRLFHDLRADRWYLDARYD